MIRKGKTMTEKETRSGQAANLRKDAEEKVAHLPEDLYALSPEETRQALHELRVHQIELEIQNDELLRTAAELEASRARYRDLYDLAPVGYCTLSEQGLILESNLTAATMFEVARGALVNKPFPRFILKEDQGIYHRQREQLFATAEPQACELRMVKKDSPAFWARLEATVTPGDDGAVVCRVVMSDITEHKREEEARKENERRLHMIVEHVNDAFYIHDFLGNITDLNDNACRMTGYTREELLAPGGLPLIDAPMNSELTQDRLSRLMRDGFLVFEGQHKRKDGTMVDVNVSARIVSRDGKGIVQSFVSDITDRKLAEEVIRRGNILLSAIIENIPNTIFLKEAKELRFVLFNRAGEELTGYFRDDLQGKNDYDFVPKEQADFFTEKDREVLYGKDIVDIPEEPLQTRNKGQRILHTKKVPIMNANGEPEYLLGISEDITERKRAEAEKAELESQNRQLQKTESLGRMAGAIAHHFNNQLGVVIGNLEMAIDDLPKGDRHANILTAAMKSAWKAAEMSSLMLTYLGQTSDKRESMDLSETCLLSLPILRAIMLGKVLLETDLPAPGPVISANTNQIQQILTNLITNAWEAVDEDRGAIHLRVKSVSSEEITTVHRHPIGWQPQSTAYSCLEVSDTGGGIADKDIEKLFDPFFSSKFPGRGLGLPVVLGIVRAHGGSITVESELDRGSIFRVFFPISTEQFLRQPDKANQSLKMERGGTVLLVEDEEMVRNMAAAMLKRLGFTVLEAKDGVEAVEVFRQRQNEIRFVLSDLTMPRMNGWETLTALRKLAPNLPVILASGYDEAHVMAGDHPELPQIFLGKPYKLKGLSDAISEALVKK